MKQQTTANEFNSLPVLNQLFLSLWKEKKGYKIKKEWTFGELVELSFALTNDLAFEDSDGRTFNNSLNYNELHIAWDGREPIEILFYELNEKLKRRIIQFMVLNNKT